MSKFKTLRMLVAEMSDADLIVILEAARIAMSDMEYLENISINTDLDYDYLVEITDRLIDTMEDENVG